MMSIFRIRICQQQSTPQSKCVTLVTTFCFSPLGPEMVKKKGPPPITALSLFVKYLRQTPLLILDPRVSQITVRHVAKNTHWTARRFVREDLLRLKYANQDLHVEVSKLSPEYKGEAEMQIRYRTHFYLLVL